MGNADVASIVVKDILKKFDEGLIPWHKAWESSSFAPKNAVTGNFYRGFNIIWLSWQGYSNPFWASAKQINGMGGKIKKDEKHTKVVFYKINEKKVENEDGEIEKKAWRMLRYYRVFNIDQTEGCKLPKKSQAILDSLHRKPFDHDPIKKCEEIIEGFTSKPETKWGRNPSYNPTTDIIGMPEMNSFDSVHEFYSTYFHELTHSTLHPTRLDRKFDYAREELVAELGACFLCGEAQIEKHIIDNSAAYLDGWRKRISEDPMLIFRAAAAAQKARDFILNETADYEARKEAA